MKTMTVMALILLASACSSDETSSTGTGPAANTVDPVDAIILSPDKASADRHWLHEQGRRISLHQDGTLSWWAIDAVGRVRPAIDCTWQKQNATTILFDTKQCQWEWGSWLKINGSAKAGLFTMSPNFGGGSEMMSLQLGGPPTQ